MSRLPQYGERVVKALNDSQDLCRRLLTMPALSEDDRAKLARLADECDFLAAQPLAELIGERGRR